eukprot:m.227398 g.227398  ORF g.227398 m.227398 type:complete len:345 (-) comp19239_c0_seq1:353-1387(-)
MTSFVMTFVAVIVLVPLTCGNDDTFCVRGRKVPSLFILGVQKSGTTTLHKLITDHFAAITEANLTQHSLLYPESDPDPSFFRKEVHFLDKIDRYNQGISWYSSYFPNCSKDVVAIDSTPNYFSNEGQTPGDEYWYRLHNTYNANLKQGWENRMVFVIIFRDPSTRFLSAFKHLHVRNQGIVEKHAFPLLAKAVEESTKLCAVNKTIAGCEGSFGQDMLRKGFYAELLTQWVNTFPDSHFVLSTMDEVKRSPERLVAKIAEIIWGVVTYGKPLQVKRTQKKVVRNHGVDLHLSGTGKRIEQQALDSLQSFYASLNIEFWTQLVLLLRKNKNISYFGRFLTLGTST